MIDTLYAVLSSPEKDVERTFADVRQDLESGVVFDVRIVSESIDVIVVQRDDARCQIDKRTDIGSHGAILVRGSKDSPEELALCWDVLILLTMNDGGRVWLTTYARALLEHLGPIETLSIEGKTGSMLSAAQFDAMLKSGSC